MFEVMYCFRGEFISVRLIAKRNGGIGYGIFRPGAPNAILEEFGTIDYANLVAQYVEQAGGSYEADIRKAAKAFARNEIKKAVEA